jgi:hypothetical protein
MTMLSRYYKNDIGIAFKVSLKQFIVANPYLGTLETFHDEKAWEALFSTYDFGSFITITASEYEQKLSHINHPVSS